jgi:hypothetical protein
MSLDREHGESMNDLGLNESDTEEGFRQLAEKYDLTTAELHDLQSDLERLESEE